MTPDEFMQLQARGPVSPDEFMATQQAAPAQPRQRTIHNDSAGKPAPGSPQAQASTEIPNYAGTGLGDSAMSLMFTPVRGAQQFGQGMSELRQANKDPNNHDDSQAARGTSNVIRGAVDMTSPYIVGSAIKAGVKGLARMAGAVVGGTAAQQGVEQGASYLGADPNVSALAGDLTGLETARRVGTARPATRPTNPVQQFHNILKPTAAEFGAQKTFETAVPEMKAVDTQHRILADPKTVQPGGTTKSAIDLADKTERTLWDQYEAKAEPWRRMGATIDANAVADAMQASRPRDILPDESARMDAEIAEFRRRGQIPMTEAEAILSKTNADLDRFEAKGPEGQRVASQANTSDVNALKAKARALRDGIYKKVGDYDEGAAPREIKRRWGAVRELRGMLERKLNAATLEYANPVQQAFDLYRGGKEGLLQAGVRAMSPPDTIDAGIWKAFQNYTGEPGPIEKASPIGNTGPRVRGLLTGATEPQTRTGTPYPNPNQTFHMPSPVDTSGVIPKPVQDFRNVGTGAAPQMRPALPPASSQAAGRVNVSGTTVPPPQPAPVAVRSGHLLPAPEPIGPNDAWQRGNPPRQRPASSVVVDQPITPQAAPIDMDGVTKFAMENKLPLADAMKELARRGYRIPSPMAAPQPPQAMPPPK